MGNCKSDLGAARPEGNVGHDVPVQRRNVGHTGVLTSVPSRLLPQFVRSLRLQCNAGLFETNLTVETFVRPERPDMRNVARRDHARIELQIAVAQSGTSGIKNACPIVHRNIWPENDAEARKLRVDSHSCVAEF